MNACVAYVLFSNPPYDTVPPGVPALMVFGGCVLQIGLLVFVWPLHGSRNERAVLSSAYTRLAEYATGLRADDLGLPDSQSLAAVRAALADPQPFGSRAEIAAYQALADEAERLRGTLTVLATEQHLLDEVGLVSVSAAVRAVGSASGPLLDAIAVAIAAGRAVQVAPDNQRAFDGAVRALERYASNGAAYLDDARAFAGQLRAALRLARGAEGGGLALEGPVRPVQPLDSVASRLVFEQLLAQVSWSSTHARHAIRLAVALTIAAIVQHLLPLAHAQWIGLTVILVLRSDFSSTYTRGVARVLGTIAGALFASVASRRYHSSGDAGATCRSRSCSADSPSPSST